MKIYGCEIILNNEGKAVRALTKNGDALLFWEQSKQGGRDRIYSISPEQLRRKMYRGTAMFK